MSVRDHLSTLFTTGPRSGAIYLPWLVLFAGLAACSRAPHVPLESFSATLAIDDHGEATVTHALPAGVYLVESREREIDVRMQVSAGLISRELDDKVPRHGEKYTVVSLAGPAELTIGLRSIDHPSKRGHADVRIARWERPAGTPAGEAELGYTAFGAAGEQIALATVEAWERAADQLNEAITHFGKAGDHAARARAAYALANVQYYSRNDRQAAVRAAEIAADAFDAADDDVGAHNAATVRAASELELAAAMNAGTQRAEQRALNEAADARLARAAKFFTERGLAVRAAFAVNMRGIRALNVGDFEAATGFFSAAAQMARANADIAEQAKSQANLAWVQRLRGFVAQAAEQYEALLPLVDRDRQTYQYAALLANYGFCLIALGDFDRALELHTESLELFTRSGDEDESATQLAALGGLYFRVGDSVRALETLRQAILAQERVNDTRGLAGSLRVAGNAASQLGQHDLALEYLRRAAQIDANPHGVDRTRVLIAGELRTLGNLAGAENEIGNALRSANPLVRANAVEERARVRIAQRNVPAAIDDLRLSDRLYADLGLEFSRIDINTLLSQLLLDSRDLAGATAAADEAVSIVGRIRLNSANPEWRARFLSARYSPFEARIAVDLASGDGVEAGWRAFRTAEAVRARSLADLLASDSRAQRRVDPEGDALRARLTAQQLRLETRMQRQDANEDGTLALRRDIEESRALIDANRLRQGSVVAREAALPESLRQVQEKLPPNTVVLAYFVGDSQSHAWLMSRDTLRHAAFAGRQPLERAIESGLGPQGGPSLRESARELGKMLFGTLLEGVSEQRMLIIPDGPLNGVPFAALPLPGAKDDLLIDRFVLGYSPSLALAMQAAPGRNARATRVAVISDPVYAPDDRRLPAVAPGGNLRGTRQVSPNKLTRLPYSSLEARAVLKTFGAADTIELAGFEATAARVLELPSQELAVLHFATHAVARRDSPEQSALFLSEYAPDGALLTDSRLTANDITRSGLHAGVVVLSGCATGDGSALRGEGVLGLTYGFLANGSRSVVASLWPVEDASTARFMNEFYRAYRATGRAADALRSAQLHSRGSAAAPVWSSFVVRANGFP